MLRFLHATACSCLITVLSLLPLHAQDVHVHVSPEGKGTKESTDNFPTIQMAMDHALQPGPGGRLYVHIAPGTYNERVIVTQNRPRTTFLGTGGDPSAVVITAAQNARTAQGTFFSETVEINGEGFEADNLTFQNTAGPTGQAVAIAVRSDRAVFKHCRFLGDQDTLFADYGRQYYVDSFIAGGVDFIFGNAAAVFDHVEIHEIRPGYLTAQSRTAPTQKTGYVILHSKVTSNDLGEKQFFLGRPWREYSRVVVLETQLPASLNPLGWSPWSGAGIPVNAYYAESGNVGPGARPQQRAPWSHQISSTEAKQYFPEEFLRGADGWDPLAEAGKLP
jgi:pectinesterase